MPDWLILGAFVILAAVIVVVSRHVRGERRATAEATAAITAKREARMAALKADREALAARIAKVREHGIPAGGVRVQLPGQLTFIRATDIQATQAILELGCDYRPESDFPPPQKVSAPPAIVDVVRQNVVPLRAVADDSRTTTAQEN